MTLSSSWPRADSTITGARDLARSARSTLEAVAVGQAEVEQHHGRVDARDRVERLGDRAGLDDGVAVAGERGAQEPPHCGSSSTTRIVLDAASLMAASRRALRGGIAAGELRRGTSRRRRRGALAVDACRRAPATMPRHDREAEARAAVRVSDARTNFSNSLARGSGRQAGAAVGDLDRRRSAPSRRARIASGGAPCLSAFSSRLISDLLEQHRIDRDAEVGGHVDRRPSRLAERVLEAVERRADHLLDRHPLAARLRARSRRA